MKIYTFMISVLLLLLLFPCASSAGVIENIDGREAKVLLLAHPEMPVIDIRTPSEFDLGALPHAENIDFYGRNFEAELAAFGASHPSEVWLVYCRSGNRSSQAIPLLEKYLPGKIYHLSRGYKSYSN